MSECQNHDRAIDDQCVECLKLNEAAAFESLERSLSELANIQALVSSIRNAGGDDNRATFVSQVTGMLHELANKTMQMIDAWCEDSITWTRADTELRIALQLQQR